MDTAIYTSCYQIYSQNLCCDWDGFERPGALQCVAVCRHVLHCVSVCCSVFQSVAVCESMLQLSVM